MSIVGIWNVIPKNYVGLFHFQSDEEEEMPAEAKMRMRNLGRYLTHKFMFVFASSDWTLTG